MRVSLVRVQVWEPFSGSSNWQDGGFWCRELEFESLSRGVAIVWWLSWTMNFEKSCLLCRGTWWMHHHCPALDGAYNCC